MNHAPTTGGAGPAQDLRLREFVRSSPLPINLMRLPDGQTLEVSDAFATFIGKDRDECLTMTVRDFTDDPDAAVASFSLLAAGTLDSYTRRARLTRSNAEAPVSWVRLSAWVDQGPRHHALGMILPDHELPASAVSQRECAAPKGVVLGTLDEKWRIDRITRDDEAIFMYRPQDLLGRSALTVVHPEDVGILLLLAAHSTAGAGGASARIRVRARNGGWVLTRITLQPLADETTPRFAFVLSLPGENKQCEPDTEEAGTGELEAVLARHVQETRAAALAARLTALPSALRMPELNLLTSREYEIVLRLASGQRVPAIARELFLSPSTVRNHLTTVFRKFDVHSQGELLDRLHAAGRGEWTPADSHRAGPSHSGPR